MKKRKNRNTKQSQQPQRAEPIVLKISPYVWAKMRYMRILGQTEVGGFGVANNPEKPWSITDFATVPQKCTCSSCYFDDVGVADFTEEMVDKEMQPFQFLRIWVHTHPGKDPHPSDTDEKTFNERFGRCDWAIMLILAEEGTYYCRLQFNMGSRGSIEIPIKVDWSIDFAESNKQGWKEEYDKNVKADQWDYYGNAGAYHTPHTNVAGHSVANTSSEIERVLEPEEKEYYELLTIHSARTYWLGDRICHESEADEELIYYDPVEDEFIDNDDIVYEYDEEIAWMKFVKLEAVMRELKSDKDWATDEITDLWDKEEQVMVDLPVEGL
jgi:hypothetical protein